MAGSWERARAAAKRAAAAAAAANRRDEAVAAVRRMRQVLPGDPGFGDPLSTAGADTAAAMARFTEGVFTEEPSASHELTLGALQVWHAALQRTGRGRPDVDVTLLFTDLVAFSSWALDVGDADALMLLRAVAAVQEPAVIAHRGRIVKRLGDGLMAVFPTPQQAFDSVTDTRARLRDVSVAGHRPSLRAGIHTGRPQLIGGDYLGVDVNVAARLVEKAAPDETLMSATALQGLAAETVHARRKKSFALSRVKGVPPDLVVYAVTPIG